MGQWFLSTKGRAVFMQGRFQIVDWFFRTVFVFPDFTLFLGRFILKVDKVESFQTAKDENNTALQSPSYTYSEGNALYEIFLLEGCRKSGGNRIMTGITDIAECWLVVDWSLTCRWGVKRLKIVIDRRCSLFNNNGKFPMSQQSWKWNRANAQAD